MIIEGLCSFACSVLTGLFSTLNFFTLPLELVNVLVSILRFGTWVVGADVLLTFTGMVFFWWSVRATFGIAVWIWRLLPLT